jgi:hypothetical protein
VEKWRRWPGRIWPGARWKSMGGQKVRKTKGYRMGSAVCVQKFMNGVDSPFWLRIVSVLFQDSFVFVRSKEFIREYKEKFLILSIKKSYFGQCFGSGFIDRNPDPSF